MVHWLILWRSIEPEVGWSHANASSCAGRSECAEIPACGSCQPAHDSNWTRWSLIELRTRRKASQVSSKSLAGGDVEQWGTSHGVQQDFKTPSKLPKWSTPHKMP